MAHFLKKTSLLLGLKWAFIFFLLNTKELHDTTLKSLCSVLSSEHATFQLEGIHSFGLDLWDAEAGRTTSWPPNDFFPFLDPIFAVSNPGNGCTALSRLQRRPKFGARNWDLSVTRFPFFVVSSNSKKTLFSQTWEFRMKLNRLGRWASVWQEKIAKCL